MKNLVLPVLLWALATSHSFAQKALPPSVAKQSVNWTYTLKKMLNAAGYELPSAEVESDVKREVDDRSSELQLDSTVTFYGYDANPPSDSTLLFRTTYTYPAAGVQVLTESIFENADWTPLNRTTLVFDPLERLVDAFSELYDPASQTWALDSRIEAFPRGDSSVEVDSLFTYAWSIDMNDWVRILSVLNTFDNENRLVESWSIIAIFSQALVFRDAYTYDDNGDNTLIESFFVEGATEYPANQQAFTYQNHLVTERIFYADDGLGNLLPQDRVTFDYTSFWKEMTITTNAWDASANDWIQTQTEEYDYDPEQRVSARLITRNIPDGTMEIDRIGYAYTEGEYVAVETSEIYSFDTEEYLLTDRKYYYYSGGVSAVPFEPLVVNALVVSPNPTTGLAQINNVADAHSVQVFDQWGKLVWSNWHSDGLQTLDLRDLPAGIYSVRVLTDEKYYAGRLVKQ